MRIGLFLFVVGATVTASAYGHVPSNEVTTEDIGVLASTSDSLQDEIKKEAIFQKGCRTGKQCQRNKGICISSSDTCNGQVVRGCGADCTCCVMDNNCPTGFYRVGTECFKVYQQFAGWDEARHICQEHGWDLAEPEDMLGLAEFLYTNISHYYFWVGGRGVGESFKYLSGQNLQDDAPWGIGYPGDMTSVGDCLILRSTNTTYETTLASYDCNSKYYFLCEPACPKGFFRSHSGCYKLVTQSLSWENAQKNCYAEGLQMAEPEDPKKLAKRLYDGIGGARYTSSNFWLGARGGRINGSTIAWNSGNPVPVPHPINNTWYSNYPRYKTSAYCIYIATRYYTQGPMIENGCGSSLYSVCELICPLGFFHIGNQCYKAYSNSASSWAEARKMCNQAHLSLAEPHDPIAVADYLETVTGNSNYWLGGKGDGYRFRWTSGDAMPQNWAPWKAGNPGHKVGTSYCLSLAPEHRTTPLTSTTCNTPLYPLCQ